MDSIILSLGSNIGERELHLEQARHRLEQAAVLIKQVSSVYETEPWGEIKQDYFLNQVLVVETDQSPEELLTTCLEVENGMGRKRRDLGGPRIIDIDLLFYHDELINTESLDLPHPRLHERRFVLEPLAEIAPDLEHPMFGESISQLLDECEDELIVKPCL